MFLQLNVPFSLLLTGTPVQNNLTELYSLLSFVAPTVFPESGLDPFVLQFTNVSGQFMNEIEFPFYTAHTFRGCVPNLLFVI